MSFIKRRGSSIHDDQSRFSRLTDDINRLWSNEKRFEPIQHTRLTSWRPDVDIEQKNNMYLIRADLPGVEIRNLKVYMETEHLIIEGIKDTKVIQHKDSFRQLERSYGSFHRRLHLTGALETKGIEAHYHNGVLEVAVPFPDNAKRKKIEVIAN